MTTDVWSSAEASEGQGKEEGSGAWVGIDFGTSNSCVALWHPQKHRAKIIKNAHELRTTPSVAFMKSEDDILVGRYVFSRRKKKSKRHRVLAR
jgi:molecular chaperone DnaK (HSP70)